MAEPLLIPRVPLAADITSNQLVWLPDVNASGTSDLAVIGSEPLVRRGVFRCRRRRLMRRHGVDPLGTRRTVRSGASLRRQCRHQGGMG
jgi:hypothetical protein